MIYFWYFKILKNVLVLNECTKHLYEYTKILFSIKYDAFHSSKHFTFINI